MFCFVPTNMLTMLLLKLFFFQLSVLTLSSNNILFILFLYYIDIHTILIFYLFQANMLTLSSTLVETVSIDYEDFNESFLTCSTCLCK